MDFGRELPLRRRELETDDESGIDEWEEEVARELEQLPGEDGEVESRIEDGVAEFEGNRVTYRAGAGEEFYEFEWDGGEDLSEAIYGIYGKKNMVHVPEENRLNYDFRPSRSRETGKDRHPLKQLLHAVYSR